MAAEAQDIVRRAIGDAAGVTVKAQLRRATLKLGYGADAWRIREALYGRAGSWSAAALDDLRHRFAVWRQQDQARAAEQLPAGTMDATARHALAARLDAIRAGLVELQRQVDELAAEVTGGAP